MIPIDTIVVPQGAEYQAVCRGLKKARCNGIQLISIPIGTKNIDRTLKNHAFEFANAKNILIMGLCGSLSEQYTVGKALLYQSCCNFDRQEIKLDSTLTAQIQKKLAIDLVKGITSDRVIDRATEKLELSQNYPASVVDMEGYDYIQKLQQQDISVAMLRVVSDELTGDIPDLSRAVDDLGNLKTVAMAIAFLKQPIAAIRLIKGSLTGLKALQEISYQLFI